MANPKVPGGGSILGGRLAKATTEEQRLELVRSLVEANLRYQTGRGGTEVWTFQRYETELEMSDKNAGPDWKEWTPDILRNYIRGLRENPPDVYGQYCQWIGCDNHHLPQRQLCAEHEIVAKANE